MPDYASTFEILLGGYQLTEREKAHITGLELSEGFDNMGTVKFSIRYSEGISINHLDLRLGASLEIFLAVDNEITQVFSGEVFDSTLDCEAGGESKINLVAHDLSYRLKRDGEFPVTLKNENLLEGINQLVAGHGIKHVYIAPKNKIKRLKDDQSYSVGGYDSDGNPGNTPWKVLSEIAESSGLKIFVRHNTLFMVDLNTMKSAQPIKYKFVHKPIQGNNDLINNGSYDDIFPVINIDISGSLINKKSAMAALWYDNYKPGTTKEKKNTDAKADRLATFKYPNLRSPDFYLPAAPDSDATFTNIIVNELPEPPKPKQMFYVSRDDDPTINSEAFADIVVDVLASFPNLRSADFFNPPAQPADATAVEIPSSDGSVPMNCIPAHLARNQEQAKNATEGLLRNNSDYLTTVKIDVYGTPKVQIGQEHNILINDFESYGKIHSGNYIVLSVSHALNDDGLRTSITLGRPFLYTVFAQGLIQW